MCMMKKSIKHCVFLHSYTPSESDHIADDSRDCTACVFVYNPTELMSRKAWRIAPRSAGGSIALICIAPPIPLDYIAFQMIALDCIALLFHYVSSHQQLRALCW